MQSVIDDVSRLIAARASIGWECWEYQSGSPPKNAMADPAFQLAHRQWVFCGQATGNRIREHRIWCSYKDEANLEELFRIVEEWMGSPPNFRVPTLSVFVWKHNQDLLVNGIIKYSWRLARLLDLIFESIEGRRLVIQNALNSDDPEFEVQHVVNHDLLRAIRAYLSEPVKPASDGHVAKEVEFVPPPLLQTEDTEQYKKGIEAIKAWLLRNKKPCLTSNQKKFLQIIISNPPMHRDAINLKMGTEENGRKIPRWKQPWHSLHDLMDRINETVKEGATESEKVFHVFETHSVVYVSAGAEPTKEQELFS